MLSKFIPRYYSEIRIDKTLGANLKEKVVERGAESLNDGCPYLSTYGHYLNEGLPILKERNYVITTKQNSLIIHFNFVALIEQN